MCACVFCDPAADFDILRADYVHYREGCPDSIFDAIACKVKHITKSIFPVTAVYYAFVFLRVRFIEADGDFINQPHELLCNITTMINTCMSIRIDTCVSAITFYIGSDFL